MMDQQLRSVCQCGNQIVQSFSSPIQVCRKNHDIMDYSACEMLEALGKKINKGKFGDCDGCEKCEPDEI